MTDPRDREIWQQRAAALRLVYTDVALFHDLVVEEIGHPLPPDMVSFVRDWLEVAARAAEKRAAQ